MTLSTSTCSIDPASEPECSKPLILRECLERWHNEAAHDVFDTGRYRCRTTVWGRGPALVLIPGIACESIVFAMLMARLQRFFRCITYELPNGIDDGARLRAYTHEDLATDLLALLDHLQIREATPLGFSFGSMVALEAMCREPDRFARGILQGGFARRPLSRAEVFCATWARFLPGRLAHVPFMRRILESNHREAFQAREPEVWDFFVAHYLRQPLSPFASRAMLVHRFDARNRLASLRQPMLLVTGENDRIVGKSCADELQRGLPRSARAEIEQCGHVPHLTHPEVLAEIVQRFIGEWTAAMNA